MRILLFVLLVFSFACKKNNEHCWQVYDQLGNEMGIVCDKTEAEMIATYGPYFDMADAKKYCWKIEFTGAVYAYPENYTEKMAGLYFSNAIRKEKITCGYCQRWSSREKHLYKPTGSFNYSAIKTEQYCGDTALTLFPGRIVTLRNTADSLITVEFLQKL